MSESTLLIKHLGKQDYRDSWQAMQDFTTNRTDDTVDEIWCLEHDPVFTQGQAGKAEHVLNPGDIPIVQTDRGGQVTYHGPGQLVLYPLINILRRKIGVRGLVTCLEQSVIACLKQLDIEAQARCDAPGVYVKGAKICSIGLRIRRGCSYHGLAFNVAMDLEPFNRINPCGFTGLEMCQVRDFVPDITLARVEALLIDSLQARLNKSPS